MHLIAAFIWPIFSGIAPLHILLSGQEKKACFWVTGGVGLTVPAV